MAVMVDIICLYSFQAPNVISFMLTNYLGCSINFPSAQQHLVVNNFISLALRRTTTGPQEIDVAMEDALAEGKPFLRWLKKSEDKNELKRKLEVKSQFIGVISSSETFYWEKREGVCSCRKAVIM